MSKKIVFGTEYKKSKVRIELAMGYFILNNFAGWYDMVNMYPKNKFYE